MPIEFRKSSSLYCESYYNICEYGKYKYHHWSLSRCAGCEKHFCVTCESTHFKKSPFCATIDRWVNVQTTAEKLAKMRDI